MRASEQLLIVSNFYEKKLAEVLPKEKYDEVVKHAFRLLMANDMMQYYGEELTEFHKKFLKMSNEEYSSLTDELLELIPETIKAREKYDAWDPDEEDDLLDFDEDIDDDDDFDI